MFACKMSELLKRKRKTVFQYLDADRDGMLTVKDFLEIANRFIESGKLKGEDASRCRKRMLKVRQGKS